MTPITIAIDGPAASGKSTVGLAVAHELGYLYFDTGVMYRAATWAAVERGVPIEDEAAVTRLAEALRIDVTPPTKDDGRQYTVYADGRDITWEIRSAAVNGSVSPVSAYAGVRRVLTAQQRRIGTAGGVVMVGRDIGTVVLPEAEVKIYLDASVENGRRRYRENCEGAATIATGRAGRIAGGDRIDSTAPRAAAGAGPPCDRQYRLTVDRWCAHPGRRRSGQGGGPRGLTWRPLPRVIRPIRPGSPAARAGLRPATACWPSSGIVA
jgi:cytidylate kinase